jgi:thiol-disulfide isomerase/thioredoxin
MDAVPALLVIAGLIAFATVLGLVLRARSTRVSVGCGGEEPLLAVDGAEVTLVQLSSPVCSACVAMRRVATELIAADGTIAHREVDVVDAPDVAARHSVLSTPTILVLDRQGQVRSRLIGAVAPHEVRTAVDAARIVLVRA